MTYLLGQAAGLHVPAVGVCAGSTVGEGKPCATPFLSFCVYNSLPFRTVLSQHRLISGLIQDKLIRDNLFTECPYHCAI